jgi:tetratricopeptide (TPR) repeat protein
MFDSVEVLVLLNRSRFGKTAVVGCLAVLVASGLAAQDKKKEWKDRSEYDLCESVTKSSDPNTWLATLQKWTQQYPQTDFADVRRKLYLETYRALDRAREAFNAAQEVLKDNSNDLVAVSVMVKYVYPLVPFGTPQLSAQQTADLDVAEKASQQILGSLDTIYSKDNRPSTMTDAQAEQGKPGLKVFAQKTLGYIALARKDFPKAQAELTKALEMDPTQGQVSFWRGTAVLAQNKAKPELQPLALYDFARASAYEGPGGLPPADRKQLQDYLNKVYTQYHGSTEGLEKLMASAKTAVMAPAGFTIKSKVDVDREQAAVDKAAEEANPALALWRSVKKELLSDGGTAYFEKSMKGALLPGGANGVTKFKGKLVFSTAAKPKELVLGIEKAEAAEVTLKLDGVLPGKMEAGAEIEFDGVAESFTKDPFMVTFTLEKSHVGGWTGKNPPPAKKSPHSGKSGASPR